MMFPPHCFSKVQVTHGGDSGNQSGTNGDMFNIAKLPGLLSRAGIDLRVVMSTWLSQVDGEITRRQQQSSRKRFTSDQGYNHPALPKRLSSNASITESSTMHESIPTVDQESMTVSDSEPHGIALGDSVSETRHGHTIKLEFPALQDIPQQAAIQSTARVDVDSLCELDRSARESLLQSLSKNQLVSFGIRQLDLIDKQNDQLIKFKKDIRRVKQQNRRITQRNASQKNLIAHVKHPPMDDLDVMRGYAKKVSWRGAISLGLRKSISFVSAASFPNAALLDLGRNTVIRAEILVNTYVITRTVLFHRVFYILLKRLASAQQRQPDVHEQPAGTVGGMMLVELESANPSQTQIQTPQIETGAHGPHDISHDDAICQDLQLPLLSSPVSSLSSMMAAVNATGQLDVFSIGATFWANDATNASIWQRNKLQGILVHSSLMVDWHALCREDYISAFHTHKAMLLGDTTYFICVLLW